MSSNNTPDKKIDEMSDLEKGQFVIDKLLPAMEQVALEKLAEKEAVKKETMAYVENAIKERNRNIAIRNAVFIVIGIIIVVLILNSLK